jgi:hypothetical protein
LLRVAAECLRARNRTRRLGDSAGRRRPGGPAACPVKRGPVAVVAVAPLRRGERSTLAAVPPRPPSLSLPPRGAFHTAPSPGGPGSRCRHDAAPPPTPTRTDGTGTRSKPPRRTRDKKVFFLLTSDRLTALIITRRFRLRVIVVRSAGASATRPPPPPQLLPASPRLPFLELKAPFVRSFVRCEPPASASRRRLPRRRCRCRCRLGVPVAVAGRPPPPQVASARQRLLTWLSPPRRVVPRARPPARHGPINPLALPPRFVPHRTHRPDRARDRQSTTPHATPHPSPASLSLSLSHLRPSTCRLAATRVHAGRPAKI